MKYVPIIDLRIRHAFYADERCPDFAPEPDPATQRLLAGCRCLVQTFADGFQISTAVTEGGQPFLPLPAGRTLAFHLRLKNTDFPLFTDLTAIEDQPAPVFTTAGAATPGGGEPQAFVLSTLTATRSESLVFPANVTSAGFTLGGKPFAVRGAAVPFQLAGLDAGASATAQGTSGQGIAVQAASNPRARAFAVNYPVRPQLPAGVFARVEFAVPASATPGALPAAYEVRFQPLAARWRYYLVSPPGSVCAYGVDFGQTATFAPAAPEASDPVGQGLVTQYGAASRVDCFTSQKALPVSEGATKGPSLTNGTNAQALPMPALGNLCRLADNSPAIFRIIRRT